MQHEPQGRLLGQLSYGELVPHPQKRIGQPPGLQNSHAGKGRYL